MPEHGPSPKSRVSTVLALAHTIEAKDPYTAGHTWRVARYGALLAAELGYPPERIERVSLGGSLHDIGKLAVPDAILSKPARLTDEEFAIMKRHPKDGFDFLRFDEEFDGVLDVVLMHHERFDGKGYPTELAGQAIPVEARIFTIVDTFDAMTSTRPYRRELDRDYAVNELMSLRGTQFDPDMVEVFEKLHSSGKLADIIGHCNDGILVAQCPQCGPVVEIKDPQRVGDRVKCPVCKKSFEIISIDGENYVIEER